MRWWFAAATILLLLPGCLTSEADGWTRIASHNEHWEGGQAVAADGRLALVPAQFGPVKVFDVDTGEWSTLALNASAGADSSAQWDGTDLWVARTSRESQWYSSPCSPGSAPGCHADGIRDVPVVGVWNATSQAVRGYDSGVLRAGMAWNGATLLVLGGADMDGNATALVTAIDPIGPPRALGQLPVPVGAGRASAWNEQVWLLPQDWSESLQVVHFNVTTGTGRLLALPADLDYTSATLASGPEGLFFFGAFDGETARVVVIPSESKPARLLPEAMPPLENATAAYLDGAFLVVGGDAAGLSVWRFQP